MNESDEFIQPNLRNSKPQGQSASAALDPILQGSPYEDSERSPAVEALILQSVSPSAIDQEFVDLGQMFALPDGQLSLLRSVEDHPLNVTQANPIKKINSLLIYNLSLSDLSGSLNLREKRQSYSYAGAPLYFCSLNIIREAFTNGQKVSSDKLPFLDGSYGDGTTMSGFNSATDMICPTDITDFDQNDAPNGTISLKIAVDQLSGFQNRMTMRSFGRRENLVASHPTDENFFFLEVVMRTTNSSNEVRYNVTSYYFKANLQDLTTASDPKLKYMGSFEDREYYLIQEPTAYFLSAQNQIAMKASQVGPSLGASFAYGASFNTNEEAAAIHSFPDLSSTDGVWIGLNDFAQEGSWSWGDGTGISSGPYRNWASGQPDNRNNEDCVHMNYGSGRKWNDGQCHIEMPALLEVELADDIGILN